MSTVYRPETQCRGKVRYRTKDAAKKARDRDEQRIGKRLRVYLCPHCDLFHLGTPRHREVDVTELKTSITEDMRFKARRAQVLAAARAERQGRTA